MTSAEDTQEGFNVHKDQTLASAVILYSKRKAGELRGKKSLADFFLLSLSHSPLPCAEEEGGRWGCGNRGRWSGGHGRKGKSSSGALKTWLREGPRTLWGDEPRDAGAL